MLILLAGIFVLHIIGVVLLLVATIDNAWWVTSTMSTDVWFRWTLQNGVWNATDLPSIPSYPHGAAGAVLVAQTIIMGCLAVIFPPLCAQTVSLLCSLEYLQAVQASSVLACIFSILGIFVFVAQLFTLQKGQRFTISGIFQLIACLCIMIAASIYTDRFHTQETGSYGHCFILAWIAFGLTFISSIIYFVLRKKTA